MYTSQFLSLMREYESVRGQSLTHEQFAALLYTMPSIVVANADGKIDETERELINGIPISLLSGYKNDHRVEIVESPNLTEDYYNEVRYLISNKEQWTDKFISVLREELKYKINDKNTIYDTMWKAAFSSKNVNNEEVMRIKTLTKELGF